MSRKKRILTSNKSLKSLEIIRIKHYSYKTERSYLNWIKDFYYLNEVKRKNLERQELSSDDVRDYLTYLAINKKFLHPPRIRRLMHCSFYSGMF